VRKLCSEIYVAGKITLPLANIIENMDAKLNYCGKAQKGIMPSTG
jgi:hypothetical protein